VRTAAPRLEPQPFLAATQRLIDSTSFLGTPFSDDEIITLKASRFKSPMTPPGEPNCQGANGARCACAVSGHHHARAAREGGAARRKPVLDESGWRQYLVRVENEAGVTAKLAASSPQAKGSLCPGSPPVAPHAQPKDPGEPALVRPLAGHADV
jgi:hypothetical protein